WDQAFVERVREVAGKLNITSTDLTIESLEFMISLAESKLDIMIDKNSRTQYLQDLTKYSVISKGTISGDIQNKRGRKVSGFIIDRLEEFLMQNRGQTFSSTELSELLDIPQPTVRTYIRNLAESNLSFKLIQGRPNFIGYFEK
ncbi:MAG: hypothetical protein ACC656_01615, partial [Candidatus Heimdallarchaeota archaeon]